MNLHIENSYLIESLEDIQLSVEDFYTSGDLLSNRSIKSYVIEWEAHNWLYRHNLFSSHTKDVDLNSDETLFRRFCFLIIYCVSLTERRVKELFRC